MAIHNDLGAQGERLAVAYLREEGFEILECNWRSGKAEIDIIVKEREVLVFIEVKTRSDTYFGAPEDFVDQKKINFLTSAAGDYMRLIQHDWEVRFDIISIVLDNPSFVQLKHIRDAFFVGLDGD